MHKSTAPAAQPQAAHQFVHVETMLTDLREMIRVTLDCVSDPSASERRSAMLRFAEIQVEAVMDEMGFGQ